MADIYDQFDAATRRIGAYALLREGRYAGKIVLHYPADGAGRLHAYVQVFGCTMVRAHASGYGYDKGTAAVYYAAKKIGVEARRIYETEAADARHATPLIVRQDLAAVDNGMKSDGGEDWKRQMENAGFQVLTVC
jgi:hypothetical protein